MGATVASQLNTVPLRTGFAEVLEKAIPIPWYIWCAALAVTSAMIGGHWDISWHQSIGRDTFWTPAHMAIYLCGVLAGISFGYVILHTTLRKHSPLRAHSVNIWGLRAPLGAFIASWGGIAMLTSAPFDNWWHDAYGLDVKIVSPPHVVLFIGIYAIILGTMILNAGHMNRSTGNAQTRARWLFLYVTGIMLTILMVMLMETTNRVNLHNSDAYLVLGILPPIVLAVAYFATGIPFAATFVAGVYTLINIALIQILPLFSAEPKLGPVYQHVTHFIPPQFPLLLIVPAFALDLLWQHRREWSLWKTAIASGVVYTGLLGLTEWFFAGFLMSPAAANRFFGTHYFGYSIPPQSFLVRGVFYIHQTPVAFWTCWVLAIVAGMAAIAFGRWRGEWIRAITR